MLTYHRPATLQEALAIRAAGDVMVLAGGTDVYPAKAARSAWGDMRHKDVLDISRLTELRGITDAGEHWRIGALTTWSELIAAELPALFDGLLYLWVGDAIVCYRCLAHYRGLPDNGVAPFELATNERYRQERIRRERLLSQKPK